MLEFIKRMPKANWKVSLPLLLFMLFVYLLVTAKPAEASGPERVTDIGKINQRLDGITGELDALLKENGLGNATFKFYDNQALSGGGVNIEMKNKTIHLGLDFISREELRENIGNSLNAVFREIDKNLELDQATKETLKKQITDLLRQKEYHLRRLGEIRVGRLRWRGGFVYIPPNSRIICGLVKAGGATICAITIFGQTAEILLPYEKQKQYEKFVECLNLYPKIRFKNDSNKPLNEEEKQLLWYLHCQKHLDNEATTFLDEWLKSFPVRTIMSLGVNLFTEPIERELERRKGWQRQALVQALNDRIKNASPTELEQLEAIINHSSQLTPGEKRRLRRLIEEQKKLSL